MDQSNLKTLHPWLQENDTPTSSGLIKSHSHDNGNDAILCLVHGYPQTSYMWRHVLPLWSQTHSLFIPSLPGYGISPPPPTPNKRAIGHSILSALQTTFSLNPHASRPIIWIGHDRGARIAHRLLTSPTPPPIHAAVLIDVVPTLSQWASFASPAAATAYFHWPFLATSLAPDLILSSGAGAFCRSMLERGRGANEAGIAALESDDAYAHYCAVFDREEAVRGSCADYADGAEAECEAQAEEQSVGRKVEVPLLVVYSREYLGRMHDVEKIWGEWVGEGERARVEFLGVGEGHGHYLPESAGEVVAGEVERWVEGVL